MRAYLVSTLCLISPLLASASMSPFATDLSQVEKPATIKVLLKEKEDQVLIEARGHYQIYNPINNIELDRGLMTKRALVTTSIEGLNWNGFFPGTFQIRIVPSDDQGSILINGVEYRGCIEVYSMGGKLHVINEIDVERYLKTILAPEKIPEMSRDVLEALAILERTKAYHLSSKTPHAYWHVRADDVGYEGYGLAMRSGPIDTAINTTRYLVLTHNHEPFATAWTKNSAGKTADFASIFRKESSVCRGIETPYAKKDREKSSWSFSLSHVELSKLLKMDGVIGIDLYQDPKTEKVYAVRIKDKGGSHDIDFLKFQALLGAHKLRSSDFSVHSSKDGIHFKGYGEGHGVGLCLYSASQMAAHGESAPKILSAFFPEAKLETLKTLKEAAH